MEKLKVKHDHTLTDILKVLVFFIFLMLPMLTYLPNALYYGFNEHATNTETTTINYKYESNEVNSVDDLVVGNIYEFYFTRTLDTYFDTTSNSFETKILQTYEYDFTYYNDDVILDDSLLNYVGNLSNILDIFVIYDNEGYFQYYLNSEYDYFNNIYIGNLLDEDFTFHFIGVLDDFQGLQNYEFINYTDYNVIESVSVNTDDTITDKMSQAWERMWQTPMYTWIDNNTFKFTINSFTSVFNISQESYIANYLTYILVITCIYLIFDIVITLTTKLTHLINEK